MAGTANSVPKWVNLLASVSLAGFGSTGGLGTPINIDKNTGIGYYLDGANIKPLSGGVYINVKTFGAKGDSDANASIGTDDTIAIQNAINYINSVGGGTLYFPRGFYKTTTYLTLCKFLTMRGDGQIASQIVSAHAGGGGANLQENTRNGSTLYSNWPSNGSTDVFICIEELGVRNVNGANIGAGFYDNCGTQVFLFNANFTGFLYGAILDQSELVDIWMCNFAAQNAGGGGLWIVNGSDLKVGNNPGFTNRISAKGCQFNEIGTTWGIIDDGGATHTFMDNNYNGCLNHIRITGAIPCKIQGGEFESAASHCIYSALTSSKGTPISGSVVVIDGGLYAASGTNASYFAAGNVGSLTICGHPEFSGGGGVTHPITGTANLAILIAESYALNTVLSLCDGQAEFTHVDLMQGTFVAGQAGSTYIITTQGLIIGDHTTLGTNAPLHIDLGGNFSNTPGDHFKLELFNNGGSVYGIGVSNQSIDYNVDDSGVHSFYVNNALVSRIGNGGQYSIAGNQIITGRQAAVTAPTGGTTIDTQARTAINDLISRLQAHGLIS